MEHRSRYSPRVEVLTPVGTVSRAKQAFKDECDINNILKKYKKTGILPVAQRTAQYGDFSNVVDYQTAINTVMAAQNSFLDLPSKVRARFDNDPAEFLKFMQDEKNTEEAVSLGLATARVDEPRKDAAATAVSGAVLPPAKPVPPVTT